MERLIVNFPERHILIGKRKVKLPFQGWQLLMLLVRAHGAVVSYASIVDELWPNANTQPDGWDMCMRTVAHGIRKRTAGSGIRIVAEPKWGFRLEMPEDAIVSDLAKSHAYRWRDPKAVFGIT